MLVFFSLYRHSFSEDTWVKFSNLSEDRIIGTHDATAHVSKLARIDTGFYFSSSCTFIDSHAPSSALNVLKCFMRVDESFLSFVVTLDGLSTTLRLVLVWSELMIVEES